MATVPTGINLPPPPLPGVGVPQPSPTERASIEDAWNKGTLREDVLALLRKHPELLDWLNAAVGRKAT